jgi:hypothetical protein
MITEFSKLQLHCSLHNENSPDIIFECDFDRHFVYFLVQTGSDYAFALVSSAQLTQSTFPSSNLQLFLNVKLYTMKYFLFTNNLRFLKM